MRNIKPIFGMLAFTALVTIAAIQTPGKAYEQKHGEWRIWFGGIQKTEGVKVSIKADGAVVNIAGTPADLGIIFKAKSGSFQTKDKTQTEGKVTRHILQEPVIVTVRSKGKELMKIDASKAEIAYEKVALDKP